MAKPASLHAIRQQFGEIKNANHAHKETLSRTDRFAIAITNKLGTMLCVYVFAGIGIGSLVGVITGNVLLATLFGAVSSYFLQLVFLPLLQLGQNLQGRHAQMKAEVEYKTTLKTHKLCEAILQHLENRPIA